MALKIEPCPGGVMISVKVVPGASRDRIMGELGDALKIAVSKPPQGGQANQAVVELLAEHLKIPVTSIQVVRGQTNPRKVISILGMTSEQLMNRLVRNPV